MDIGKNFVYFGKFDKIDEVKKILKDNEDTFFKKKSVRETLPEQRETRIELCIHNVLKGIDGIIDRKKTDIFLPLVLNAIKKVEKKYGYKYSVVRGLNIVKLKEGGKILEHIDSNGYYPFLHRIHLPIVTNENCIFKVGKEKKHLKEGNIYEINNCIEHSVENNGESRVHIVIDLLGIGSRIPRDLNENLLKEFYSREVQ